MKDIDGDELARRTEAAQSARARLKDLEAQTATVRRKAELAKRRLKEAKAVVRQAKKEARRVKAERREAEQQLALADAKLNRVRAQAEKTWWRAAADAKGAGTRRRTRSQRARAAAPRITAATGSVPEWRSYETVVLNAAAAAVGAMPRVASLGGESVVKMSALPPSGTPEAIMG